MRLSITSILAGVSIVGSGVVDKSSLSSLNVEILAALASILGLVVGFHHGDAAIDWVIACLGGQQAAT